MSESEAIERVADMIVAAVVGASQGRIGLSQQQLGTALKELLAAHDAKLACTLLTRETEAMGGYRSDALNEQLAHSCEPMDRAIGRCKCRG